MEAESAVSLTGLVVCCAGRIGASPEVQFVSVRGIRVAGEVIL